jgi:hypothetical protein
MKTTINILFTLLIVFLAFETEAQIQLKFTGTPSVSGTAGAVGTKYTWSNVGTTGSTTIKAVIEIISKSSTASLEHIDQSSTGSGDAWQPIVNGSQTSGNCWSMEFRVRFYNSSTNERLSLSSFKAQGIDIDGDGDKLREFNRFDNPASYSVESNSYLTTTYSSGNYTFKGPTSVVDGIDLTKTRYIVSCLYSNTDSLNIVLGGCCDGGSCSTFSGTRLHSINFKNAVTYNDPVPVTWLYFNIEKNGLAAEITWATATEINNSHFEVYRSGNGLTWEKIGSVKGNGNSNSVLEYEFIDKNPLVLNFYKLKQVDFDGKFEYTAIRVVDFKAGKITIQGYPNPNQGQMTLDINRESTADPVQVDISDIQGNVILAETFEPNGSQNLIMPLDISAFRNGLYILRVISGQSTQSYKFTKF